MEITVSGVEVLKKDVKHGSGTGVIYVPKNYIGSKVLVVVVKEKKEEGE